MPEFSRRNVLAAAGASAAATALSAAPAPAAPQTADTAASAAPGEDHAAAPMRLWYRAPAQEWLEALPVGNGRLGAMVFGGTDTERLQLNEDSLWAGGPGDYARPDAVRHLAEIRRLVVEEKWNRAQRLIDAEFLGSPSEQAAYQVLGDLELTLAGEGEAADYERELDLETAVARTTYTRGGVRHVREVFASAPDQVLVVRLSADTPGAVGFTARFTSPQRSGGSAVDAHTIALDGVGGDWYGRPGSVRFRGLARAESEGGRVSTDGGTLTVEGADAATLVISWRPATATTSTSAPTPPPGPATTWRRPRGSRTHTCAPGTSPTTGACSAGSPSTWVPRNVPSCPPTNASRCSPTARTPNWPRSTSSTAATCSPPAPGHPDSPPISRDCGTTA